MSCSVVAAGRLFTHTVDEYPSSSLATAPECDEVVGALAASRGLSALVLIAIPSTSDPADPRLDVTADVLLGARVGQGWRCAGNERKQRARAEAAVQAHHSA